jgi:L-ascorbate metabolism protein UlaG (beta-lactamase superfamily)
MQNQKSWRRILRMGLIVPLAGLIGGSWMPVEASSPHRHRALDPESIAARQRFFGLDNVDPRTGDVRPDRVILSWTGVSSFVAAFRGHVVLLDAYIAREGGAPLGIWPSIRYVGSTPEELAAVKPELILFGHSHFDHMGDLPTVVRANPDAILAGTAEHCGDIEEEVTDVAFECLAVFEEAADLGTVAELPRRLLPGVGITAVKQPHSSAPPDPAADPPFPWGVEGCRTFPGLAFDQFPVEPGEPLSWDFETFGPPSGIIAVMWQIRVGDFAVAWQDTAGPITGACQVRGEIGCETVPDAFASLPETDVRLASIVVSGRSVLTEHNEALAPKLFLPIHHDACGYFAKKDLEDFMASLPEDQRPVMWFLSDPGDYLRPISFDPRARAWKDGVRPHHGELSDLTMGVEGP